MCVDICIDPFCLVLEPVLVPLLSWLLPVCTAILCQSVCTFYCHDPPFICSSLGKSKPIATPWAAQISMKKYFCCISIDDTPYSEHRAQGVDERIINVHYYYDFFIFNLYIIIINSTNEYRKYKSNMLICALNMWSLEVFAHFLHFHSDWSLWLWSPLN